MMNRIPNAKFRIGDTEYITKDLLLYVVRMTSQKEGSMLGQMEKRIKIIEALMVAASEIELEDDLSKELYEIASRFPFGVDDQQIVDLVKSLRV